MYQSEPIRFESYKHEASCRRKYAAAYVVIAVIGVLDTLEPQAVRLMSLDLGLLPLVGFAARTSCLVDFPQLTQRLGLRRTNSLPPSLIAIAVAIEIQ